MWKVENEVVLKGSLIFVPISDFISYVLSFGVQLRSTGCASTVFATGRREYRLPAPIAYQTSVHLPR